MAIGGLFSGNKKSATTNSTTTNNSTTLGVQGDLSGILGDGNKLFTDNSENDNSTTIDWRQDNNFEQDNSDNSERNYDGQFSGAQVGGNLIVTGDGAWKFGEQALNVLDNTMQTALKNSTEQSYVAIKAAQDSAANALDYGRDSLRTVESTSKNAIEGVLEASSNANKSLENTALELANMTKGSTQQAIEASNAAMAKNAALIQTTALGGQDLMIDAMKKVLMFGAGFLAVSFVAINWSRK